MSYDFLMAMSCTPAAIAGVYRYNQVELKYRPFILTLLLSLFTELVSRLIIILYGNILHSYDLYYVLANFYIITNVLLFYFFFLKVGLINGKFKYAGIVILFSCLFTGWYFNHPLHSFPVYCGIVFSTFILILSVKLLSIQVFETRIPLLKNALFYIAAGCIIFYTHEVFSGLLGATSSDIPELQWYIYVAEKISNVFHYVLFLAAVLWMPKKK